ncbi:MAG: hypothetical protein IH790_03860 [Acidobacteria bacterium]|nr:hypothetical protein [Acidobacteriota bacterium]
MATPILSQPQTITQFDLSRYATLANQIDALKAEQLALVRQLITAIGSGANVEKGMHTAQLKTSERRNVSWKAVVIRLKGSGYASRILSHTKPKTYIKLVVR